MAQHADVQREARRNEELRETIKKLERERAAQRQLEALHHAAEARAESERLTRRAAMDPVTRLAELNARRAAQYAAIKEKDCEVHRNAVNARSPAWWPREVRLAPPRDPPPQPPKPEMVAMADRRLGEIRLKLEAGQGLAPDEESDAVAILELQRMWAARMGCRSGPTPNTWS